MQMVTTCLFKVALSFLMGCLDSRGFNKAEIAEQMNNERKIVLYKKSKILDNSLFLVEISKTST